MNFHSWQWEFFLNQMLPLQLALAGFVLLGWLIRVFIEKPGRK